MREPSKPDPSAKAAEDKRKADEARIDADRRQTAIRTPGQGTSTDRPSKAEQDAKAAEDKRQADARTANPAISTTDPAGVYVSDFGTISPNRFQPDHHPPAVHRAGVEMRAGMVLTEDQKVAERHGVVQSEAQSVAEKTPHLKRPSEAQVRQDAPQTLPQPLNPKAYTPDSTALAAVKNARQALKDFNPSAADQHLIAAEQLLGSDDPKAVPRQPFGSDPEPSPPFKAD